MVLTAAGILLGHGWHRAATSEASILTQLEVGVPKLEGGASMKRMVVRKDSAQDDSENENALAGVGYATRSSGKAERKDNSRKGRSFQGKKKEEEIIP